MARLSDANVTLAKEIIGLHHGTIAYRITDRSMSAFDLEISLHNER